MARVAVIGGGIIGVASAVFALRQIPGLDLTIISDEFTPNTTSDGVAGLWSPFLIDQTPPDKIHLWSKKTHDLFRHLWRTPKAEEAGLTLIPVRWCHQEEEEVPYWADIPMGFRELTLKEVKEIDEKMTCGFQYITFTCEPIMMLPFLMRQFKDMGGKTQRRKVDSLTELAGDYDIIIHCTGVEACHVVGDKTVHPKRGQAMRVKAPWVLQVTLCDYTDDTCIYQIPNRHSLLLGGTHQEGDWNTNTYPKDTKHILDGGCKISPGLKNAEILKEWVGLRPGRWEVRLERETIHHNGKKLEVIHNYGHGGAGITMFWGCAEEATDLLKDCLREMKGEVLQSKL